MSDLPDLQPIHSLEVLTSRRYRRNYEYWSSQTTERIVKSLALGHRESLTIKPDGRVVQGNTRITILLQRGYDVKTLPREIKP